MWLAENEYGKFKFDRRFLTIRENPQCHPLMFIFWDSKKFSSQDTSKLICAIYSN